jgi:membrane protein
MKVRAFFSRLWAEGNDDSITDVAAMMTYYAIFALFPMLVFLVTVALLVVPSDAIQATVDMAARAMPASVAELVREQVVRMEQTADAGFAIGGALIALWGASRGAAALMTALDRMFEKKETRPWWKRQLVAIGTTLLVAMLLLIAMALLTFGPIVGHAIADRVGLGAAFDFIWDLGRWIGAALLVLLVWALLYWLLPDTDAPLRIFTPGAIAGVALWLGVTKLFAFYLDRFASYQATYGALAGVIVLLTWLWLSNLVLLLGAEINDVLADLRADKSAGAKSLATPTA